jgi:uncharacterized protein (TIGR00369 family)
MSDSRRFGIATREEIEGLTGLEFLDKVIRGELPAPPLSKTLGLHLVEASPGRAVFQGDPSPALFNPLGGVHGGFALALIDSATGCSLHSELPPGTGYTTVETKVNFVRPVPSQGTVRCEGRLLSRGRQIATAEAQLISAEGKLLAHGTSTLIILPARG